MTKRERNTVLLACDYLALKLDRHSCVALTMAAKVNRCDAASMRERYQKFYNMNEKTKDVGWKTASRRSRIIALLLFAEAEPAQARKDGEST